MNWILRNLWLIPAFPLIAAGLTALAKQRHRKFAAGLAVSSISASLLLSCVAFVVVLQHSDQGEAGRQVFSFPWLQFGDTWLRLGWVLDGLTAVILVMVSLVGLLILHQGR